MQSSWLADAAMQPALHPLDARNRKFIPRKECAERRFFAVSLLLPASWRAVLLKATNGAEEKRRELKIQPVIVLNKEQEGLLAASAIPKGAIHK